MIKKKLAEMAWRDDTSRAETPLSQDSSKFSFGLK